MPRRRALTKAQLENLLALPVTEADLVRHWTLGDDDLAIVSQRRRNHNQLGFALLLCALRGEAVGAINAHYGREVSALFYTHVSARHAPYHTVAIPPSGEAAHVIDGLLYH